MNPDLSLVIPAFNEEKRILKTLNQAQEFFREAGLAYEILVIDDGSKDTTALFAQSLIPDIKNLRVLSYPHNQGKGFAVRFGMANARGKLILMADADGATPFQEFTSLMNQINQGAEIAVGSRALKSGSVKLKTLFYRKLLGRTYSFFVRTILGIPILDTQCGFKLFKKEVADYIFPRLTINGFGFDVEVLFIAFKNNFKVSEVPVNWYNVLGSKVNVIKDSLRMFMDLIFIRLNNSRGAYK